MVHKRDVDALFDAHLQTGEDEARLRHVEGLLEQWMLCEPHLPDNYERKMARNFVRGAKFNLDTAKKKLEGYFLAKHAFPEFYQNRDPGSEQLAKVFDCVNIVRLPKLTEEGERICFMSLASPDPADFDMVASIKMFWMLYDLTLTSEHPVTGEVLIFDCSHFSSDHMVKFLSPAFKHALTILRDAYAARVSQLHVINCPATVEKLTSMLMPLVHEKVRKRVTIHKGTDSLLKYFQPEVLPADVGGNLESLRDYMSRWREFLVENSEWFRQQENIKIVGTPPKRIQKFTYDVGLVGSFRQLNID